MVEALSNEGSTIWKVGIEEHRARIRSVKSKRRICAKRAVLKVCLRGFSPMKQHVDKIHYGMAHCADKPLES